MRTPRGWVILEGARGEVPFSHSVVPPSFPLSLLLSRLPPQPATCKSTVMSDGAFLSPEDDKQQNIADVASAQSMAASGSSMDPASSLRAAALLTLKSKRRKPVGEQPMPIEPIARQPPVNTIELDYGQDEVAPVSLKPATPPVPQAPSQLEAPVVDMEDGQIREEGEISDSEEVSPADAAPPANMKRQPTPPPSKKKGGKQPPAPLDVSPILATGPSTPSRSSALVPKLESPSQSLLDRITDTQGTPSTARPGPSDMVVDEPVRERPLVRLDANHVRPGLESLCCALFRVSFAYDSSPQQLLKENMTLQRMLFLIF